MGRATTLKSVRPPDDVVRVDAALATRRSQLRRRVSPRALGATAAALVMGTLAVTQLGSAEADRSAARQAVPAATPVKVSGSDQGSPPLKSHPKVVVAVRPGEGTPATVSGTSRPQSDAEIRAELAAFRRHLQGVGAQTGPVAKVLKDGSAVAPSNAPNRVLQVIAAANEIASTPYKWGGGHGAWSDSGYDCSGSVSFALAGAGLLQSPLTSGLFMNYGDPGPGRWITIYANGGHMFMVVAGLRYDTSGANGGTRWQSASRSTAGFTVRHPPGF